MRLIKGGVTVDRGAPKTRIDRGKYRRSTQLLYSAQCEIRQVSDVAYLCMHIVELYLAKGH